MILRISLVGSFNLADGYLGAARALERMGHAVSFVPAHLYFAEFPDKHLHLIIKDLIEQSQDVVLWWRAETIDSLQLGYVRKKIAGKFIVYSWDDPHQWEDREFVGSKCRYWDVAYSCCQDSLQEYLNFGAKNAIYCPPGFDPEIHYPEEDDNYKCDVSIVCTNLYHGDSITRYPHISRKDILDAIVKYLPDIDLRIYGSSELEKIYPKNYKGWIPFNESRKVFRNSKINLCTHIRDGQGYINERVCQITGSGGLLLCDGVSGPKTCFEYGSEFLIFSFISPEDFSNQVKDILDNYEKYEFIKERSLKKALNKYTWDNWSNIILEGICLET